MRTAALLLLLPSVAVAGDKPIDPVVAAAWGWTAPEAVLPTPTPVTPVVEDPRGVWSPYWDGRQWVPRWVAKGGAVVQTVPFPVATTRGTPAHPAAGVSTAWPGSTGTAPTRMYVLDAGRAGGTNACPPSG